MLSIDGSVRVYLAPGVTDMRKSIDTLTILVAEQMALDPLSGHLFAFCNRKRDTVKILCWDRNGFCLYHKRLERDRFRWPDNATEVRRVGLRELRWLLDGLSLAQPIGQSVVGQFMPAAVAATGKTARGQRPDMRLPETNAALGNGRRKGHSGPPWKEMAHYDRSGRGKTDAAVLTLTHKQSGLILQFVRGACDYPKIDPELGPLEPPTDD